MAHRCHTNEDTAWGSDEEPLPAQDLFAAHRQRERRRLHLRHMQAWPQGISATCTARTMHTLQSRPGTPGGPSPFSCRLRPAASSCLSGMSTMVSFASPAEAAEVRQHSSQPA